MKKDTIECANPGQAQAGRDSLPSLSSEKQVLTACAHPSNASHLEPDLLEPEDVEVPEEEDEEVLPDAVPLVPDDEGERRDGMASIKTQISSAVSNVINTLNLLGFPGGIQANYLLDVDSDHEDFVHAELFTGNHNRSLTISDVCSTSTRALG